MSAKNYWSLSVALLLYTASAGCGGAKTEQNDQGAQPQAAHAELDHGDPHDVPLTEEEIAQLRAETETWAAAVQRIQSYRDTIRAEINGPTPALAHRPLDLLDHLLEWLPDIARANQVPRQDWQTIGTNAQTLRDLFEQLHANLDAGDDPDYASVAGPIDQAIAALAEVKAGAPDE